MNYFELFELPVQLKVDRSQLPRKFFELSRKYHPDYFAGSDAETQSSMLEISAQLNKAFKTFQDPDETIRYVLLQKGLLEEEEAYKLDNQFLGQVLGINEQLMELEFDRDPALLIEAETEANNLLKEIYHEVEPIVDNYLEGVTTEKELLQVKAYYYKKKYLKRILDKIAQLRNIAPL